MMISLLFGTHRLHNSMMGIPRTWCGILLIATMLLPVNTVWAAKITLGENSTPISIKQSSIFPESIWANTENGQFLVGSFRDGNIYEITPEGVSRVIVSDDRLRSVLGITVDQSRQRIYVANADIGVSLRSTQASAKKLAALGVYDLNSGEAIHYIDLGKMLPTGKHLANGVAVDDKGNAYVTDSFSPVIYRVDVNGNASVFATSPLFEGKGINLNGIAYHPDGYLLVIKKSDGVLFKVSVDDPKDIQPVDIPRAMIGGDGVLLVDNNTMVIVANKASGVISNTVFSLTTDDQWRSAKIVETQTLDDVYPTTATRKDDGIYVVYSRLHTLIGSKKENRHAIRHDGKIIKVGTVTP